MYELYSNSRQWLFDWNTNDIEKEKIEINLHDVKGMGKNGMFWVINFTLNYLSNNLLILGMAKNIR